MLKLRSTIFGIAFSLYFLSLATAPLYFGGERLLSWVCSGLIQSLVFLLTIYFPNKISSKIPNKFLYRITPIGFGVVVIWGIIQIIPLDQAAWINSIWSMKEDILLQNHAGRISIVPDESILTVYKFIVIFFAYSNGVQLIRYSGLENPIAFIFVVIGTAYAAFGLYWQYAYPNTQVWMGPALYNDVVSSTFINRNTFAMYMAIHLQICLAVLLSINEQHGRNRSLRSKVLFILSKNLPMNFVIFSAYFLQFTALILTASRAGLIFCCIGQVLILFLISIKNIKRIALSALGLIGLIPIINYVFTNYSANVTNRSSVIDESFAERMALYREIWNAGQIKPYLGYGLGSFENVFRMQKSISFDPGGIWLRAHNIYLEGMISLGIPVAIFLIITCLCPVLILLIGKNPNTRQIIKYSALGSSAAVALHSIFDFGLQSAANALTYFSLMGIGIGLAHVNEKTNRSEN